MDETIKKEEEIKTDVVDETELDKSLEESIKSVQAGKELTPKEEVKPEEKKEATPETPKVEDNSTPPVEPVKEDKYEFRVPNKGKFESDESFEKRIELLDLVKKRKLAKSPEQKQQLSEEIKVAKSQIKNLNGTDKFINPLNQKSEVVVEKTEEDELLKADRERLKQLGGATKEDIEQIVQKERLAGEIKSTLDKFVDRHIELKDEDTREVFFDFVDSNYNWQNKSGKELMTVLELARESMFKPSETIQERVLKGANVQEKVNAMQFPGGTIAKTEYSPEMAASIKEMVATGMSEEKAIELLSE
jgi:hypothetical protein